jgi:8-oxo-dGTP pyrophosphatase MutT (NUDIX family)
VTVPIDVIDHPDARNPALPAATVVLARDSPAGIEVLMIQRGAATAFGGMWAFPGGVIEEADVPDGSDGDPMPAARRAAVREALEEVALVIDEESLVFWSHWLPPDLAPRRFSTWFFLAPAVAAHDVVGIDGHEVDDHRWVSPASALDLQQRGEIALAPPTMVTLDGLCQFASVADAVAEAEPIHFRTRVAQSASGVRLCLWEGDVAYDGGDADADGPRHRVVMDDEAGWRYLNTLGEGRR